MPKVTPDRIEKCTGAMLATAIGDALGWPYESRSKNTNKNQKVSEHFVEWTRRSKASFWFYEKILPGEYSDDTQLTLSVARSIILGNWENALINKELPLWLDYERGGGGAVLKAARACKKGTVLWKTAHARDYFNAGGNGAAMRILPHVIAPTHSADINSLMIEVVKDVLITHGHPRAVLGATCYAYALDFLLKKDTVLEYGELVDEVISGQNVWGAFPDTDEFDGWREVASEHRDYEYALQWESDRDRMISQLEYIKSALKKGLMLDDTGVLTALECFGKVNGAGDVAVLAAIYLVSKYANNPILGIKIPAFAIGADTDTIASITGGLFGMLCGTEWIPIEWKMVQDFECLVSITELLLSEQSKAVSRAFANEAKQRYSDWEHTPIGLMRTLGQEVLPDGKYATVTVTKRQSVLGQTMYFKFFQKNEERRKDKGVTQVETIDVRSNVNQITIKPVQTAPTNRKFTISQIEINKIKSNPLLSRITFKKILGIIDAILTDEDTVAAIAKRMVVNQAVVELLMTYMK